MNSGNVSGSYVSPKNADLNITWSSSDQSIASAHRYGRVSSNKIEFVEIAAASSNGATTFELINHFMSGQEVTFPYRIAQLDQ